MKAIRVLFVDDEPHILNALRRGLIDAEYECFFVESAEAALKILEQNEISVIVTDMRMPCMDGLTLLKIIRGKYPDIVKIVLSGYAQLQQILATINQVDVFKFITKPWKMEEEFKDIIQQAIDYHTILAERKMLKEELERKNAAYKNMMSKLDVIAREAQRESKHVRELTDITFASIHKQVDKTASKMEFAEFFTFVWGVYQEYTKGYPFAITEFALEEFWNQRTEELRALPEVSVASAVFKLSNQCKVKQSAGNLAFAVHSMQKALMDSGTKYYCKIIVEEKIHIGTNKIIECSVIFSYSGNVQEVFYQRRLDFLSEFLTMTLKFADIGFAITKVNQNIAAKFQLKSKDLL